MKRWMALIAVICLTNWAIAQEAVPTTAPESQATESHSAEHGTAGESAVHGNDNSHPILSTNTTWAGSMVIIIVAMFVCAAVVGVVVRLNLPEPAPEPVHDDHSHGHDDHGHDEHAKGGHGH